jgi:hypothetical protein
MDRERKVDEQMTVELFKATQRILSNWSEGGEVSPLGAAGPVVTVCGMRAWRGLWQSEYLCGWTPEVLQPVCGDDTSLAWTARDWDGELQWQVVFTDTGVEIVGLKL